MAHTFFTLSKTGLDSIQRMIIMMIQEHQNMFPALECSIDDIMEITGLKKTTTRKALAGLIESEFLKATRYGDHSRNVKYELTLSAGDIDNNQDLSTGLDCLGI